MGMQKFFEAYTVGSGECITVIIALRRDQAR